MAFKYLSLKEIEDAVIDPNFGKNIVINTYYNSHLYTGPSSHSYSYSYSYSCPSSHSHPHPHPYLGECPSQDLNYNNYNLKPPVYKISKNPVRAISIPPLETLTNIVTTSTFVADTSYTYAYPYAYTPNFDAAHFNNVNADILAATAISERLKAKSDAFEYLSRLANKDVALQSYVTLVSKIKDIKNDC
jgi:hypothetical protein